MPKTLPPFYAQNTLLRTYIPNAKLVVFETGGHMLIGHGEDTRAAIKDFLKQHQQIETAPP
jgi:hypothetical protein